ncbi:MAG: hypothetical protein ACRDSJ_06200 [Rubrobacteraceae bacterium]
MSKRSNISEYCVYTILHRRRLDGIFETEKAGEAKEKNVWREGERLFREARKNGERMPVVFSAADVGGGLFYYAFLEDVDIDEESSSTKYKFARLTKIEDNPPKSSLKLKSSGRALSDDYIRPYAVCHTPSFVRSKDV